MNTTNLETLPITSGQFPEVPGYTVERELGRGGMGVVYLARQSGLNRLVALKITISNESISNIRFLAECEAVAAIRNEFVVEVYQFGENAGRPFLTMEYCPGGSLAERIKKGPYEPAEAVQVVSKIALGVAAAHAAGVIHRDLKPGNILFAESGEPKVVDFGIAKLGGGSDLTKTTQMLGTPSYVAPEQARGDTKFVGPQADVWSLGVVLYEMLTRVRPFRGETHWQLIEAVCLGAYVPPRRLNPKIPIDLELICAQCLRLEPTARYATAALLAEDLQNWIDGRPIRARPLGRIEQAWRWSRRNPVLAGLIASVAIIALGLTLSLAQQYRQAIDRAHFESQAKLAAENMAAENASLAAAEQERRRDADAARAIADAEALRANSVSDFMAGLFRSSDPLDVFAKDVIPASYETLRGRTARDFLDEASKRFELQKDLPPLAKAKLLTIIGTSYSNLGEFQRALKPLQEAKELREKHLPADHVEIAASEKSLGQLALDSGDYLAAERHFQRAVDIQTKNGVDEKQLTVTRLFLSWALSMIGRPTAIPILQAEIALREKIYGPLHSETVFARLGLAAAYLEFGEPGLSFALMPAINEGLQAQPEGQIRSLAEISGEFQKGLALRYAATGPLKAFTLKQAKALLAEAVRKSEIHLPKYHPYRAMIQFELALVLDELEDSAAAEQQYRDCVETTRRSCGLAHPKVLVALTGYTNFLWRKKRPEEARKLFDEVANANLERFGRENFVRAALLCERAKFEYEAGADSAVIPLVREIQQLIDDRKVLPVRKTLLAIDNVAFTIRWRHPDAAEKLLASVKQLHSEAFGGDSKEWAIAARVRGTVLISLNRYADAAVCNDEAAGITVKIGPKSEEYERCMLFADTATILRARGRWADALAQYQECSKLATKLYPVGDSERQAAAWGAIGCLVELGRYAEAIPYAVEHAKGLGKDATPAQRASAEARIALLSILRGDKPAEVIAKAKPAIEKLPAESQVYQFTRLWNFAPDDPAWSHEQAAEKLKALVDKKPTTLGHLRELAKAMLRCGKPDEVPEIIARAQKNGDHWENHLLLGRAATAKSDWTTAKACFQKVEALFTANPAKDAAEFPYRDSKWETRLEYKLLRDQLVQEIGKH